MLIVLIFNEYSHIMQHNITDKEIEKLGKQMNIKINP